MKLASSLDLWNEEGRPNGGNDGCFLIPHGPHLNDNQHDRGGKS